MSATHSRASIAVFLGSLSLLSAFLLFQIQPVISKFILPWFGGSPGVWTTCMVFFQVLLFGGYAYAHFIARLQPRWQAIIHTTLIIGAFVLLPIAPAETWKPTGNEDPAGQILLILLGTVGLPYFILSSTSPLTQVWFTRAIPGGSPWRLYALSNVGSLVALISYPFFFEPRMDVITQTKLWSVGFAVFGLLSLLLAWRSSRNSDAQQSNEKQLAAKKTDLLVAESLPWLRRAMWIFLPALASVMLLATTNHVCQDVAVVPFMWVIPLSLYLLTFIICFEHERWYRRWIWAALALLVIFITAGGNDLLGDFTKKMLGHRVDLIPNYRYEVTWCFSAMFLACMVCHGELGRLKPAPARLTEFYLCMSAGGAIGGMLVSLVAPRVFVTFMEWPLGLILCLIVATVVCVSSASQLHRRALRFAVRGGLLVLIGSAVVWLALTNMEIPDRLERVRNFYGTVNVREGYDSLIDSDYRILTHGGTQHGMQNMAAAYKAEPITYYGRQTGIGKALDSLHDLSNAKVGVVGLGTGTVACYAQKGQSYRFYEINPEVVRMARKYFTYLDDAEQRGASVTMIIGDARLTLEHEPDQQFDVILLDAFSGDAIPMHLLTREAFQIYRRHMKPDGIIAVHVTNSYLQLFPVVEKQAAALGWSSPRISTEKNGDHYSTDYAMVTQNQTFLQNNPTQIDPKDPVLDVPLWTDRYHNLFQIMKK
jgi:SAM-dependent methyltransferase